MSEENKVSTGNDDAAADKKPARKTPARKPAPKKTASATARKSAPKKTGAASSAKAAAKSSTTRKTTSKATAPKKPAAKKAAPKPAASTPVNEDTPEATAAAAASAPQHGDILEDQDLGSESGTPSPASDGYTPYEDVEPDRRHDGDDPYSAENLRAEFAGKDWGSVGTRAAFTIFYIFASWVALSVGAGLSIIQFLVYLVSGERNEFIGRCIITIGKYIGDVAAYFSFATDDRPFPFGKDLPSED